MNRLYKIITVLAMIVAIISISISAYAYTNADVIAYISKAHTVNGRTEQLKNSQRQSLKKYLQDNPVTDEEANSIISKLEQAKKIIADSGASNLSELGESAKARVTSLVKDAGNIAGLDVQIDTENETVTIKDFNGNVIVSPTSYEDLMQGSDTTDSSDSSNEKNKTNKANKKLVYTGHDYSVVFKIIAIVAIAIVGIVIRNRYAK